jgi:inosine-uridine nucleoside N-ribohydrolase
MKRKIIIDTDPGVDDAMAIQFALGAVPLEVVGLTTVFGNVPVELATANALRLLHLAGRGDIPVAQGTANPLWGPFEGGFPCVHGEDGQGNVFAPESPLVALSQPAAEFLVEQLRAQPGEITLVAVGPLTNLAQALALEPGIVHFVREVVIMGGNALCPGNATPAAEANVLSDPDAADLVLGAGWPLTMVGLDVTHRVNMRRDALDQLARLPGPLARHVSAAIPFYRNFFERVNRTDGFYVHDSSAIAYLLAPELFDTEAWPVRVDVSHGIGRGKTWPSLGDSDQEGAEALRPWQDRPRIKVCLRVDGPSVVNLILDTLRESNL